MAIPSPNIFLQFHDRNGKPLSKGKIYTYKSGTNILKDTYKDSAMTAKNTNPIILNDDGTCNLFVLTSTDADIEDAYRFEIFDYLDNLIKTEDQIYSTNGKDGKSTGLPGKQGEPGEQGLPGVGIVGRTGPVGPTGRPGKSGSMREIWRSSGDKTFKVPASVNKLDIILGGAGGGYYIGVNPPSTQAVGSGKRGSVIYFSLNVTEGDIINFKIGKGGDVSASTLTSSGQASTMTYNDVTYTANGGTSGFNYLLQSSGAYQIMSRYFKVDTDLNGTFEYKPGPVFGESSEFGEGGNIYKGNLDGGNCASGGCSIPVLVKNGSTSEIQVESYGNGGDGICIISYQLINNDEE